MTSISEETREITLSALHDYRKWFQEGEDESDREALRKIDRAIEQIEGGKE